LARFENGSDATETGLPFDSGLYVRILIAQFVMLIFGFTCSSFSKPVEVLTALNNPYIQL
jgi:hypothetical protein